MQQTYSTGRENYENKKETVNLMRVNDPDHTTFFAQPSSVRERLDKQITETKNDLWLALHDIFGALRY